jgi:hypothetical protein
MFLLSILPQPLHCAGSIRALPCGPAAPCSSSISSLFRSVDIPLAAGGELGGWWKMTTYCHAARSCCRMYIHVSVHTHKLSFSLFPSPCLSLERYRMHLIPVTVLHESNAAMGPFRDPVALLACCLLNPPNCRLLRIGPLPGTCWGVATVLATRHLTTRDNTPCVRTFPSLNPALSCPVCRNDTPGGAAGGAGPAVGAGAVAAGEACMQLRQRCSGEQQDT